eukprot:1589585-Amphidinium_carterae.3
MRSAPTGAHACGTARRAGPTSPTQYAYSTSRRRGFGPASCMLGKLRKVSHVAWFCVLTFEANQGVAAPEVPPPLEPKVYHTAHPRLQKMLLLRGGATQERIPCVELRASPQWQAAQAAEPRGESPKAPTPKWEAKPPAQQQTGPIRPLRKEAAQERTSEKGAAPGGTQSPSQTPEGQASQLSGWSGTAGWGGSSANSAWGNGSWERQGRSGKGRSPSRRGPRPNTSAGGQQERQADPQQRKRPHSKRKQSRAPAPKFRDMSRFGEAWDGGKPELTAVQPHATFYEDAPPHQAGVPRGKFNVSGVLVHRATVDGDPKVIISIPAAVADLVTQRVVVEMVAGRTRKATAKMVAQTADNFRRRYPEVLAPVHADYEFFSFLRDRKLVYPEVWEIPGWFRKATLLAAAEKARPLVPLREGGYTYEVQPDARDEEVSDDDPPPTSPASVAGEAGQGDVEMPEAPKTEETDSQHAETRGVPTTPDFTGT